MIRFAFKKGLRFLANTKVYTLLRRQPTGRFQIEDQTGELHNLTEAELHKNWISGKWQIDEDSLSTASNAFYLTAPQDLRCMSSTQQEDVKRKLEYIQRIGNSFKEAGMAFKSTRTVLDEKIKQVSAQINDPNPPKADTVWEWWRRFAPTKCATKLVAKPRSRRREDPIQRSIFEEAIAEVYLTAQKLPGLVVVECVKRKVERMNKGLPEAERIRVPSQSTIYRWLSELHHQVVSNARNGRKATTKELRSVVGTVNVSRILERVELDHTPCDVMVICKTTRLILGRPWITLAIDRFSRMVVGFYISFHAPSQTSVLYTLRMMILPKDQTLEKYPDVIGPWPARGLPDTIATDNGLELHAHMVESVALEMGINLHYCGVAHPEMKGAIERAIGTLNRDLFHKLPGTTFSNIAEKGDYDSEKNATIDIDVLTHLVVKWIVDQYHKTPHRGLRGRTPLQVWQEGEKDVIIELPAFPRQLDTMVGYEATRSLFHYGIEYDNLKYNSPLLQTLKQKMGGTPQLRIRSFEDDVGFIAVFHPDLKEFIDVPAVDQAYAGGVNRYIHKLIFAEVRRRFANDWTQTQLLNAKAEIQEIVDDAIRSKKTRDRKANASVNLNDSERVLGKDPEQLFTSACAPIDPRPIPDAMLEIDIDDELPTFNKSNRTSEYA